MTSISVIMPAFNAQRYIAAALDSIFAQTHQATEVIVVDDGSTDATPTVLANYNGRITAIVQPNQGGSAATNRGIAASSGQLLAFLDADDLWISTKLRHQLDFLVAHSDIDAVFGYVRQFVSEELTSEQARLHAIPDRSQPGISKNLMLIRRAAFERVGYFDETLRHIDFFEWYTRAVERGLRTHVLPDLMAFRRLHLDNTGIRSRASQHAQYLISLKRSLDRRRTKSG